MDVPLYQHFYISNFALVSCEISHPQNFGYPRVIGHPVRLVTPFMFRAREAWARARVRARLETKIE